MAKVKLVFVVAFSLCGLFHANTTCITRRDCNGTEVCYDAKFRFEIKFDSLGGSSFDVFGDGQCAQCGDMSMSHCFAPCYVDASGCAPDPVAFDLNFDWLIPFYLGATFGLIKLIFSMIVFTPKKDKSTSKATVALRAVSVCFMANALVSDLLKLWHSFTDPSMTWWLAVESITMIWISSSNMPAIAALGAMCNCGAIEEQTLKEGDVLTKIYFYTLLGGYFLPGAAMFVFAVPTFVAYAWFFVPALISAKAVAVVLAPVISKLVVGLTGHKHLDNLQSKFKDHLHDCIDQAETLSMMQRMKVRISKFGGPDFFFEEAIDTTIFWVLLVPITSIALITQARLFDGYGYVQAFYLTITERHIATYLNLARQSGMHALNMIWLIM